jgi:DNA-directed RNA polymerase subunit beta'
MSLTDGQVTHVDEEKRVVTVQPDKQAGEKKALPIEYKIPGKIAILVAKGDVVKENQALCGGSLDLKKLYKASGLKEAQQYILKEVQKIYASQGVDIQGQKNLCLPELVLPQRCILILWAEQCFFA